MQGAKDFSLVSVEELSNISWWLLKPPQKYLSYVVPFELITSRQGYYMVDCIH